MNRVANRTTLALMLALILIGGMLFFLAEFLFRADDWTVFEGTPHIYNGTNIGCGGIYARDGEVLLSALDGREYSDDADIRKSTLHWLGDRAGYISAPVVHRDNPYLPRLPESVLQGSQRTVSL